MTKENLLYILLSLTVAIALVQFMVMTAINNRLREYISVLERKRQQPVTGCSWLSNYMKKHEEQNNG